MRRCRICIDNSSCINNIGSGIGAALTGLNIIVTSITCLILSISFIEFGCRLTYDYLGEKTVKYAEYIASLLIMFLARIVNGYPFFIV